MATSFQPIPFYILVQIFVDVTQILLYLYLSHWYHMGAIASQITPISIFRSTAVDETSTIHIIDPLWRESTDDWWISLTNGNQCKWKTFRWYDCIWSNVNIDNNFTNSIRYCKLPHSMLIPVDFFNNFTNSIRYCKLSYSMLIPVEFI